MDHPLDWKFKTRTTSVSSGKLFTEENSVVFLARDAALPDTLAFYQSKCAELGASPEQIHGIGLLRERLAQWQRENAGEVKVADVAGDVGRVPPPHGTP